MAGMLGMNKECGVCQLFHADAQTKLSSHSLSSQGKIKSYKKINNQSLYFLDTEKLFYFGL